jgi:hypothetical protein
MSANLSKAVCSSTLGHLIVSNNGSRFQFLHDFTNLLVSQAIDVLEGKEGSFRIRTNWSKARKEKVSWPDSILDDYLYRPVELEDLCYYDFVAKYEKVYKTFKQMKTDDKEISLKEFAFHESHPGYEFCYLKQRRHEVVPIAIVPDNSLCRISELEMRSCTPISSDTMVRRDTYAKTDLVMFHYFLAIEDLQADQAPPSIAYWTKFTFALSDHGSIWRTGVNILHNIDDRETAKLMKPAVEPLTKLTTYDKPEKEKKIWIHKIQQMILIQM